MSKLLTLAQVDQRVMDALVDTSLNHQRATEVINGFIFPPTSRTSVRRAREELGVVSPQTTFNYFRENVLGNEFVQVANENPVPAPVLVPEMWPEGTPATVVVVGDYQIGLHDDEFIKKQCDIIADVDPDIIISTGDDCDFTAVGRWVQGLPDQFGRTIHEERQIWVEEIAPLFNAAAPNAIKRMCDSNHIRRLPQAIERYIPGLRDAPELFVKNFLKLDELGWIFDEGPTEFLPGVVYSHGDEVGMTSRSQASKAREVIKTRQRSIVFGHTHQAALNTTALGYGFNMTPQFSLNVGHGMRLREASYIKSTSPDWSRGIGILYYDGENVHPSLHLESGGRIRVNGKVY